MKYLIFLLAMLSAGQSFGQAASAVYRKADSLYKAKEYRASATTYMKGMKLEWTQNLPNRMASTAASWAMAGVADSAFYLLKTLSTSPRLTPLVARNIQESKDLAVLKGDKRWQPLIDQIVKKAAANYPQEEIIYGRRDGMALTLVRVNPKVKPNGKAIIFTMAGSWVSSYRMAENYTIFDYMVLAKGYTVFMVIVCSQPKYSIPDQVVDLKRAIRFVRYHAPGWGLNPNKLGITGSSAGGHLSLTVATADEKIDPAAPDPVDRVSSRVQAVAVLYPPTDLANWDGKGANWINDYKRQKEYRIFGTVDFTVFNSKTNSYDHVMDTVERTRIAREISPIYSVTADDPPTFIIHGDADTVVPIVHSQSFIARLQSAGVPNRLVVKKGGRHDPTDMNPEFEEFPDWFDRYLK